MSEKQDDLETVADGLADRLRNLLAGLDRRDRLETAGEFAGWLSRQTDEQLHGATREVLLRALHRVSDPVNYGILQRLDPLEGIGVSDLVSSCGLERVALSERLYDLVQVGLVSRELIDDQVRATPLAIGVCRFIEQAAGRASGRLSRRRGERS